MTIQNQKIKIGNKYFDEVEYAALIPTKKEVDAVMEQSEKIKLITKNENQSLELLNQKSIKTLHRNIKVYKYQMQLAFEQCNIEGYLQCHLNYWQAFKAITLKTETKLKKTV